MNFIERAFDHQNQWWKYAIILIVGVFGGQLLGSIPLVIVMMVNAATSGGAMIFNPKHEDFTVLGISKNVGLLLMLLPFVVTLIITVWFINVVHKGHLMKRSMVPINCVSGVSVMVLGYGLH